jgi:hypothetical protein
MFALRLLGVGLVIFLASVPSDSGEKPDNKEKVVGVWDWQQEYVPWHYVARTGPATIEFTKDGKIRTSDKVEGTYAVDGKLLKVKLSNKTATWEILDLDGQRLLVIEKRTDNLHTTSFKKK